MKLFVSDLDGTLYPHHSVKNERQLEDNLAAVRKWVAAGNQFAIATARSAAHNEYVSGLLGFTPNYIGCNGAELVLANGERRIKTLPMECIMDICALAQAEGANVSIGTPSHNFWLSTEGYPFVANPFRKPLSAKEAELLDELLLAKDMVLKLGIFVEPTKRDNLKQQIAALNYPITVTTSDIDLIDAVAEHCSKGEAIKELCELYHIDKEDLVVIGDSENDIAMFKVADKSYCLEHSEDIVRESAAVISSVAEAIERELGKK